MSADLQRPKEGIYRRVTVRMYGDERFTRLSPLLPSGQALWIYLLTGPHTGPIPGVFVAGRAALAEALGWEPEAFAKAFQEVIAEGLAEFDEKARLWFIPNALMHNTPPNPNVVKSWRSPWLLLPESGMRDRIFQHVLEALTEVSEAFGKAFAEACGKAFDKSLPKPSAKGMAKQEAGNRKQEAVTSASSAMPTIPCPYPDIVSLYHEKLPTLPRIKMMEGTRKKELNKFWGWVLGSKKLDGTRRATNAEEALDWFGNYFARAAENDFLMGRTERTGAHANWRCDFDFLLTEKGLRHVIEKTEVAA